MGLWTAVFVGLSVTEGVGDNHPGHRVPFWQQACVQDARNACDNLALILDTYCQDGSGWACNEVGAIRWHGRTAGGERAPADFLRACLLGFDAGCQNGIVLKGGAGPPRQGPPRVSDYPVILRTGKGALPDSTPEQLFTRACDQGWATGCEDLGALYLKGDGVAPNPEAAAAAFTSACDAGLATACSNVGLMLYMGDGLPRDEARGLAYLQTSCDLGFARACAWLKEYQ
jgi:hypothetical protein